MEHVFYLVGVAFIIYSIISIINFKKHNNTISDQLKIINNNSITLSEASEYLKNADYNGACFGILYIAWMIKGFFTINWLLFALLIVINIGSLLLANKASKYKHISSKVNIINNIITTVCILFIILNNYYFNLFINFNNS